MTIWRTTSRRLLTRSVEVVSGRRRVMLRAAVDKTVASRAPTCALRAYMRMSATQGIMGNRTVRLLAESTQVNSGIALTNARCVRTFDTPGGARALHTLFNRKIY